MYVRVLKLKKVTAYIEQCYVHRCLSSDVATAVAVQDTSYLIL